MHLDVFFVGLSAVFVLCLGGLVLLKGDKHNASNWLFFGFTAAVFFWMLSSLLATYANIRTVGPIINFGYAASIWIAYFFLTFCVTFVDQSRSRSPLLLALLIPAALLSAVTLMGKVAIATATTGTSFNVSPGQLYLAFAGYLFAYALPGIAILWVTYTRSRDRLREQIFYIFIGTATYIFLALLFSVILPSFINNPNLYKGGTYSVVVFIGTIAYAIVAKQLFDIRIIIRKTLIYSGLLLALLAVYSTVILLVTTLLGNRHAFDFRVLGANIFASFLISLGFNPLNHWLENTADRVLFRKDYERQLLLKDLSHKLNDVLGLDEALETVMQGLVKTFQLQHAATYVFQMGENSQVVVKRVRQIGYPSSAKLMLEDKDFITTYFASRESILLVESLRQEVAIRTGRVDGKKIDDPAAREVAIKAAVSKKLGELDAAVAIPLRINGLPIGLILLSPKLSQEPFTEQDLSLIDLIGAQVTAAIQKARLYESDQMKSEFVSIASHELLTPISAMEGYLSMILDEHMGKADAKAQGYLDKVYASAKRLSALVKDMLSASRIEAGKMKIDPQQLDMGKVINDTITQLGPIAKEKKLTVTYEAPKGKIPPVWSDPDRTVQVLTNLIDNALKYTFKGGVTVTTTSRPADKMVQIDIADTGLGMPKDRQAHLFEKFYRVYSQDTADVPGTGLGLYITKSLIEKMGGQIWLASTEGQGSTFSFTLPIFAVELSKPQ